MVKDAAGKPVEGAKVIDRQPKATTASSKRRSNKKGEFIQIGLAPAPTRSRPRKTSWRRHRRTVNVSIPPGAPLTLVLGAGGAAARRPKAAAKNAELKKTFDEGVAASRAGNHDEAIAKFTARGRAEPDVLRLLLQHRATRETQKKDFDKAEAAYKKAIELKADYAEAYSGLANVYNAQRKFDQAAAASAKAMELSGGAPAAGGGGGNADALFNQGVILWNAGKIADAKKQFEAAIAANPNHAEAHYQLGMALVNEGNLAGAGDRVRNVPEARAERTERGHRQGDPRAR